MRYEAWGLQAHMSKFPDSPQLLDLPAVEDFGDVRGLGAISAGKWESLGTAGMDGVLECAQSCSAFPDLIPIK